MIQARSPRGEGMKRFGLVSLVTVLWAVDAAAMGIREDKHPLAHSDDGKSVLFEVHAYGPEGGGGLHYLLVSPSGTERIEVSSTFSPGDGSQPQRIDRTACEAALQRIHLLTAGWKARVVVHTEVCGKHDRAGAVTTTGN
jgi:hypothetical protein